MDFGQGLDCPIITNFLDLKEESLSKKDFDIFDPVLTVSDFYGLNQFFKESRPQ